jgi:hypothetical protein
MSARAADQGQLMRKLGVLTVLTILAVAGYALWPVLTAYQIRQAVKSGDSATLERKIVWPSVRESLKSSIAELQSAAAEERTKRGQPSPSLWSRVKSSFVPYFADNMIDRYVTAESIANLDSLKAMWRQTKDGASRLATGDMAGAIGDMQSEPETNALTRFMSFYNRIQRARFDGLDKVEFEITDRYVPERRYLSRFELNQFEWKLVSVRVAGVGF